MFSCVRQSALRRVPQFTRSVLSTHVRPNEQSVQTGAQTEETENQMGKLSSVLNEEALKMESRRGKPVFNVKLLVQPLTVNRI